MKKNQDVESSDIDDQIVENPDVQDSSNKNQEFFQRTTIGGVEITMSRSQTNFRIVDSSEFSLYLYSILNRIEATISSKIPRIYALDCRMHLINSASACAYLFQERFNKKEIDKVFKNTEKVIKSRIKKKYIHLYSGNGLDVYSTKEGRIIWNLSSDSKASDHMLYAFHELVRLSKLSMSLLNHKETHIINSLLSSILIHSTKSNDIDKTISDFDNIEKSINSRATSNAKLKILFLTILTTLVVLAICMTSYYLYDLSAGLSYLVIGLSSGTIGAFVSIVQRNDEIAVDSISPFKSFIAQAFSRLLLGMTFGVISILLIESKLITFLNIDSVYAFCILGVVAGFSERFVPDFLDNISSKKQNPLIEDKSAE